MESQPQNREFRNNPESLHPCLFRFRLLVLHAYCYARIDWSVCCCILLAAVPSFCMYIPVYTYDIFQFFSVDRVYSNLFLSAHSRWISR